MSVRSWSSAKLAEVTTKVGSGATPRGGKEAYHTEGVPLIRSLNIHFDRFLYDGLAYLDERQARDLDNVEVRGGDVLLNITGASIGRVNRCPVALDGARVNQHVCIIRPVPELDSAFLRYLLSSPQQQDIIFQIETGVTRQALTKEMILNLEVPIAPLNEQRRIVAKIEELFSDLDAGVAALERVRANLKRYRAAVLKAAVEGKLTEDWRAQHPDTEPASVLLERILAERRHQWEKDQLAKFAQAGKKPSKGWREKYDEPCPPVLDDLGELEPSWCWARIEQLASTLPGSIQSGPFGSNLLHSEFQSSGVLAIGIDNTLDGRFSMGQEHRISERKFEELAKYEARPLDVLITVMATVGRCCVVPENIEKAIITKHVYRITPDKQLANPYYLQLALSGGTSVRKQLFGEVRGQTRPGINGEILRLICIPLPSIGEQAKIVEEVQQRLSILDEIEAQVDANLKRAARLRQGILKRAFEGRLLPQDPTDEPAEKLLERIRQQRQPATTMYNGRMGTRRARRPRRTSDPVLPFPQDDGSGQGGKP